MAADLRKVRKVLDYVPAKQMRSMRDHYLEALDRRLHREVLVERPLARPQRDEAVRVVAPEEWEAARRARDEQVLKEAELEQARNELERVQAREDALRAEIDELRARLGGMRTEAAEKRKVALQLLGVRRVAGAEPALVTEPTTPAEEAPQEAGSWEVVPEEDILEPAPPAEPPRARRETPGPSPELVAQIEREAQAAEDALQRVEQEIEKIESELQTLAQEEAGLRARAGPYTHKGYTLHRRTVGKGEAARDLYFFSKGRPKSGQPSPLPAGYIVSQRKGGAPVLKRSGAKARRTK